MAETPEYMDVDLDVTIRGTARVQVEIGAEGVDKQKVARDIEDQLQAGLFDSVLNDADYRVKPV